MKRTTVGAVAIVALALSGGAQAAQSQFNLTCVGEMRTLMPALLLDETKAYTTTYRIDLDAMMWCSDACKATWKVVEATPTAITLEDKSIDTPREHEVLRNVISRTDGAHQSSADSGTGTRRIYISWKGQCEPSAFTGFPVPATKF
jgi:predicted lipoprotein with Yx(FWY)xxD motif